MAKTVIVNMTDDIDGTCADQTVAFSFDGSNYEIDLGSENAAKMRSEMTVWAHAGRPAPQSARDSAAEGRRRYPERIEATTVRGWARRHGLQVGERGRLPLRLVQAYESANQLSPTG